MSRLSDKTYSEYYQQLFDELKLKIMSEKDDLIITTETDDLVKYYYSKNSLHPINFNSETEETIEHKKYIKTIPANQREWAYQYNGDLKIECEKIVIKLPIIPNNTIPQVLQNRTQSISLSGGPEFTINGNKLIMEIEIKGYGINLNDEQITKSINGKISSIKDFINKKNNEINQENEKLKKSLAIFIKERKDKLDSDKNRLENLVKLVKIPLERKDDDLVRKIRIEEKPFVKKIKPNPTTEDYQLNRDKVIDIIKLLSNQCLQFEKTPRTYEKFAEENLRDLLLANLNSIFEGKATGETFNNKGKTDIYLNIDKGNILICECKFYGGEKLYHKTIEQIISYLSWRQNYGIIINFCKKKNFSNVLKEAESIISSHSSYDSGLQRLYQSHFLSKHVLTSDDYKYVEIHHLYFNLYNE